MKICPFGWLPRLVAAAAFSVGLAAIPSLQPKSSPDAGISFEFKGRQFNLIHPMKRAQNSAMPAAIRAGKLDTLSNWYSREKQYIEIIRQDDPYHPLIGLALGFEFDEANGEYPYTPARAVIQLKDFGYGGLEFSLRDTCNYTGVSNQVSDDIQVEIDSFIDNRIFGRFSGVLISGAGPMAAIEKGRFEVLLHRID